MQEPLCCPGYLISLPQVLDVCRLHPWWDKGQLALRLEGLEPTAMLMDRIDILQASVNELEGHIMAEAQHGSR